MNADDFRYLVTATETIALSRGTQRERDDRIASLMRYGQASAVEIMGATGLTKSRIYQIFEAKYGFPISQIDAANAGQFASPSTDDPQH